MIILTLKHASYKNVRVEIVPVILCSPEFPQAVSPDAMGTWGWKFKVHPGRVSLLSGAGVSCPELVLQCLMKRKLVCVHVDVSVCGCATCVYGCSISVSHLSLELFFLCHLPPC